ncbi:DNA topoisomerase II [Galdieria sulphuraria]|uniref:DNA topoisomerase 2 n=1 Tax=Galdieria sulphuraria TaxID=130081 RepID=M2Y981_GALSU|nr:DNA topoisomerase II [Galdieria sulphuraria]EME32653.1 DNA topoisomerase II [Galdieria sulphuraria]|eukprot:XP_005709173.1 DNA topoisomerase II [Galdieria sulphuraria]
MDATSSYKTVEDTYQKLTPREHVLLRPDTYIGSVERTTQTLWVYDRKDQRMSFREVSFVPALYKIFDEILVNAADHKQRDPSMNTIRVDIHKEDNKISIYNNGKGIPVEIHKKENIYVPEMIFGHLLTSSNYDDSEKKVVGGRNGYGAKLTNIFSKSFIVETADSQRGLTYRQEFSNNMSSRKDPKIMSNKKDDWTKITFVPDLEKFSMTHLDEDILALFQKRVFDVAGCNPTVKVYFNGEHLPIKSFRDYCELYLIDKADVPRIYECNGSRWEVMLSVSEGQFTQVSFVNSIWTMKGGTHVNHIVDQIISKVNEHIEKKHKGLKLKPFQIKNHLWVFVKCLIENPAFDSQTKENMTSRPNTFGSSCPLSEEFMKKVMKSSILENVLSFAKMKQTSELKKTDGGKAKKILGIPKLDDANYAGTKESFYCTLILTEGDSAKALAVSGLSVVGRDYYGVFPLRGKLLNVREASHKQIMENAEINNLKKILGLQHGKVYDDETIKTLRYGHVLIMTDQDNDGSHIKGLLINFFHHFWPSLLEVKGFLQEFITPIVKASKGNQVVTFFTIPEYKTWRTSLEQETLKGWTIKYYKGLGTSTAAEAKEYFSHLDLHVIDFIWSGEHDMVAIDMAFSKQRVQERKEWLADVDPDTYFDHIADDLTYSNFVNKELILFSLSDNARSIPSVIDGLKPSQRKVLFGCFKKKLTRDIKVAQLAGYIAENAAYHHGEMSLMATIVGLAQNFVGACNINLLVPSGQFGTRLQGGKDAASARYIFTRLAPITRYLFPEADDAVLHYLEEDGLSIEPNYYCPIIPLVLVNGAEGIGTGWSTNVPCYNPKDVIENIRRLIHGHEPHTMHPWYRGFRGSICFSGSSTYDIYGKVYRVRDHLVRITELPLKTWTTPYKEWLESIMLSSEQHKSGETSFIKELFDRSTERLVDFLINLHEEAYKQCETQGFHKKFKLGSTLSTSNMVLFNAEGKIQKYDDPIDMLKEFFHIRLRLYESRKQYLLQELTVQVEKLENRVRFILQVIQGEIKVANVKRKDLIVTLTKHHFKKIYNNNTVSDNKDEEEEKENDSETGSGYDYLLSMPIWSLTQERITKLTEERDKKIEEMKRLEQTAPSDLWLQDLEKLEQILDESLSWEEEESLSLKQAAMEAKKQQKTKLKGKKNILMQSLLANAEQDDKNLEEIPPPSSRKASQAKKQSKNSKLSVTYPKVSEDTLGISWVGGRQDDMDISMSQTKVTSPFKYKNPPINDTEDAEVESLRKRLETNIQLGNHQFLHTKQGKEKTKQLRPLHKSTRENITTSKATTFTNQSKNTKSQAKKETQKSSNKSVENTQAQQQSSLFNNEAKEASQTRHTRKLQSDLLSKRVPVYVVSDSEEEDHDSEYQVDDEEDTDFSP